MDKSKTIFIIFEIGNMKVKVILQNGFFDFERKIKSPPHSHANFELHFMLEGNMNFETEDGIFLLNKNDICLIPPSHIHQIGQEKNTSISSFSFSISKLKRETVEDVFSFSYEILSRIHHTKVLEKKSRYNGYLKEIISAFYANQIFSQYRVKSLFVLLFTGLLQDIVRTEKGNVPTIEIPDYNSEYDVRIAMIEEYFNRNFMHNITISDLAKSIYLGEKQTSRMIQKAFGTSFQKQLDKHRINSAKRLLKETEHSVKSIAEMVGYQSYNGFFYLFKRETNMTAIQYRAFKRN